jgi:hypothetical protein
MGSLVEPGQPASTPPALAPPLLAQVALRYNVYASLAPEARFTRLNGSGEQLAAAVGAFNELDRLIGVLNWWAGAAATPDGRACSAGARTALLAQCHVHAGSACQLRSALPR